MAQSKPTSDTVAGWATGVGIGLATLMVMWLLANRLTAIVWDPPVGPTIALTFAILTGATTAWISGHRLAGTTL